MQKLRLARHHSAAGQPGNPVAAHLVDWFYVTSFTVGLPQMGHQVLLLLQHACARSGSYGLRSSHALYPSSICTRATPLSSAVLCQVFAQCRSQVCRQLQILLRVQIGDYVG